MKRQRILWYYWQIGSLVAFVIAALAVGERLRWWDMLGEVIMAVFTVGSLDASPAGAGTARNST
jgi:hypothetical protein